MASGGGSSARDEAIRAIARRRAGREEQLARQIVARYRKEIVDYRAADDSLSADAFGLALDNLEALLADLERGEPLSNGHLGPPHASTVHRRGKRRWRSQAG